MVGGASERVTGWAVAFDTDAHAETFAAALARHGGAASRSGRLVGYSTAPTELAPSALLALEVPSRPSAPPLGPLVLVDAWKDDRADAEPTEDLGRQCEFAHADVRVTVPDGWKLTRADRGGCHIVDPGGAVVVGEVVDLPAEEARLSVQRTLAAGMLKRLGTAATITERRRSTAFGVVRSSVLAFSAMTGEAVAIPLCGGRRSLAISTLYATEEQRWGFDRYVASLSPTSVGRGPSCLGPPR